MGVKRGVEMQEGNGMLEFESLRPKLKKLLTVWTEPDNWHLNLRQVCEKAGLNYNTIRKEISRVGVDDFYELKAHLIDRALARIHGEAMKALLEKIRKGNTRAIELYLKATGRITERVELSGGLNLNIQDRLLEAKKRLDTLGEGGDSGKDASGE